MTATINAVANSLMAGSYSDTIAFTNTTNGNGNTNRAVTLTVNPTPGALSVSPAEGLSSSGFRGGPFTPSSVAYTLTNGGGVTVSWTASRTQSWVTLSAASGTLSPGASTTLTVSLNSGVNALAAGTHADTVTITNTTNGAGNTTRPVALTVIPLPALSVSPANRDVTATAGTTTFSVSNSGGGTFDWTAQVISGGGWLTLQSGSSGTDNGTITAAFVTNPGLSPRQGTIRVSAAGATGSPVEVTVTQAGGYLDLSLAGQRLVEKAWIIEREYGRLVLTVEGSPSVIVDRFVIYRKIGDQAERVLSEVPGSSIQGGTLIYNDTFLEKGTNYTYHIVALDSLGAVLRESNSIVI